MEKRIHIHRIYVLLIFIFPVIVYCQDSTKIDSLSKLLPELSGGKKVDVLLDIANAFEENDPHKEREYAQQALSISESLNDSLKIANSLLLLGNSHMDVSDYDNALKLYFRARDIAHNLNNKLLIMRCSNVIAIDYFYTDNKKQAITFLKNAIAEADTTDKYYPTILNNYAGMLNDFKKYDEALEYFFKALRIYEAHKDSENIGMVYGNLANNYTDMGKYETALEWSKKDLELEVKYASIHHLADAYGGTAELYIKLGKYDEALKYLKLAENTALKGNDKHFLTDINKQYSDLYKLKNNYKLAFEYLNRYTTLNDSLINKETKETDAQIKKYETQKRDSEIKLLEKDNQIQTLYRNSFIGAFVFAFILAGGLYNRYRFKSKANKELTVAREKSDEANQLKTELLGIAAHDLKNPLNSILGFAQLLKNKFTDETAEKEYVMTIEESSNDMLELIKQLLNSSAIESGKIDLQLTPVDFNSLAKKTVDEFSSPASLKKQILQSEITNETLIVNVDKGRLKEVMNNLISNAVKYSDYGKTIKVNLKKENENAVFEVIDEGPGLTEKDRDKLFGKFQRLSAKPTGGENSTGLGLSIAKQLIELQGGTIGVESEYGKGSTFYIVLPLSTENEYVEIETDTEELVIKDEEYQFEHSVIVIADDLSENRKLLKGLIDGFDFTIFEAVNGKELVELVRKVKPDLIFTDIKMPEMDGFEALKNIKEDSSTSSIPIYAVTAEDSKKVMEAGFNGILKKPVEHFDLLSAFKNNLKSKEETETIVKQTEPEIKTDDIINRNELAEKINNKFLPIYESLKTNLLVDDIEVFSLELNKAAREHNSAMLKKYSNELSDACGKFDIMNIKKSLDNFDKITKAIGN